MIRCSPFLKRSSTLLKLQLPQRLGLTSITSVRFAHRLENLDPATLEKYNLAGADGLAEQPVTETVVDTATSLLSSNIDPVFLGKPVLACYDFLLSLDVSLVIAIPIVTAIVRSIIFPVQSYFMLQQQKEQLKDTKKMLEIKKERDAATNEYVYYKKDEELINLMMKSINNSLPGMYKTMVPAFLHSSNFLALRAISKCNYAPVLSTTLPWSGFLPGFATSFAACDPIIPAITLGVMCLTISLGVDDIEVFKQQMINSGINADILKKLLLGFGAVGYVVMYNLPVAITYMMLSNAVFNLIFLTPIKKSEFWKKNMELPPGEKELVMEFAKMQQDMQKQKIELMRNPQKNEERAIKIESDRNVIKKQEQAENNAKMADIQKKIAELERLIQERNRAESRAHKVSDTDKPKRSYKKRTDRE